MTQNGIFGESAQQRAALKEAVRRILFDEQLPEDVHRGLSARDILLRAAVQERVRECDEPEWRFVRDADGGIALQAETYEQLIARLAPHLSADRSNAPAPR